MILKSPKLKKYEPLFCYDTSFTMTLLDPCMKKSLMPRELQTDEHDKNLIEKLMKIEAVYETVPEIVKKDDLFASLAGSKRRHQGDRERVFSEEPRVEEEGRRTQVLAELNKYITEATCDVSSNPLHYGP
ncbi:hypothetical protein GEMRC1_001361 [Eukaryota sp. GEM-RC1]